MLWVEVLNRALEWNAPGHAACLHPQAGARLAPGTRPALDRDVQLLRRVFAARVGASPLDAGDTAHLSQWLAAVTLHPAALAAPEAVVLLTGLAWPEFVARRGTGGTFEPFETLVSTALVQLLGMPADWLATVVHRCHGVRRGPAPQAGWPAGDAGRFAAAASLGDLVDGENLHQCPRLVWSERGRCYCSKACSNASFAARKARCEPRYFAAKQGRYRTRRKRQQTLRPQRGAFVYID